VGGSICDTGLLPREAEYCRRHRDEALRFAARFAAKEAFISAWGLPAASAGMRSNCSTTGRESRFSGFRGHPEKLDGKNIRKVHVSISHTAEYAVAFVVFEPGLDKSEKPAERN